LRDLSVSDRVAITLATRGMAGIPAKLDLFLYPHPELMSG